MANVALIRVCESEMAALTGSEDCSNCNRSSDYSLDYKTADNLTLSIWVH